MARSSRPCVRVSWLRIAQPTEMQGEGGRCRRRRRCCLLACSLRYESGGPWRHWVGERVLRWVPVGGRAHFSPFFQARPPPFVLLIEFFPAASGLCAEIERRARRRERRRGRKEPVVNYRAPNLKYIPLYRLIQPSDVTFFSFAG